MGFLEFLTIVFIVLKLTGFISWGWFFVLLPEIIAILIYISFILFFGSALSFSFRKTEKQRKNMNSKKRW